MRFVMICHFVKFNLCFFKKMKLFKKITLREVLLVTLRNDL